MRELALRWVLGEIMGVGASVWAHVIHGRAVLFMGEVSFRFIFCASFRIVGFLNVFCPGGNLLFFCLDFLKSNFFRSGNCVCGMISVGTYGSGMH